MARKSYTCPCYLPRQWHQTDLGCTAAASGGAWYRSSCSGISLATAQRNPWSCAVNEAYILTKITINLNHHNKLRSWIYINTHVVSLIICEWMAATPFTVWLPTMARCAMLMHFSGVSSTRDMRRTRSASSGHLAVTTCRCRNPQSVTHSSCPGHSSHAQVMCACIVNAYCSYLSKKDSKLTNLVYIYIYIYIWIEFI